MTIQEYLCIARDFTESGRSNLAIGVIKRCLDVAQSHSYVNGDCIKRINHYLYHAGALLGYYNFDLSKKYMFMAIEEASNLFKPQTI